MFYEDNNIVKKVKRLNIIFDEECPLDMIYRIELSRKMKYITEKKSYTGIVYNRRNE